MITNEEFIKRFPTSNLNLSNKKISKILSNFISTKTEDQLIRSWQTVRKSLFNYFESQGHKLEGKNNMDSLFWQTRGWNPKVKISEQVSNNLSNTSKDFYINHGFSESEAIIKAKEFQENIKKERLLPTQLEYYTKKGFSESEAQKKLKEEQTKRVQKLVEKEKANPELRKRRLWNQIEYYTNKGYSEKQGYQLMEEKFKSRNLQTMKKLVEKYQKDGFDYYTSLEKAQKEYKERAMKTMKTRIKNNSFGWQKASKQSLDFFKPLMEYLDKENIEYYVGDETHTEYFIAKGNEYFYSYDFCIPSQKLIIEYNGEHIHPNPNMSKENWDNWTHCWSKKSADECREIDLEKIKVAESLGYKVIEVFESDVVKSLDLI